MKLSTLISDLDAAQESIDEKWSVSTEEVEVKICHEKIILSFDNIEINIHQAEEK